MQLFSTQQYVDVHLREGELGYPWKFLLLSYCELHKHLITKPPKSKDFNYLNIMHYVERPLEVRQLQPSSRVMPASWWGREEPAKSHDDADCRVSTGYFSQHPRRCWPVTPETRNSLLGQNGQCVNEQLQVHPWRKKCERWLASVSYSNTAILHYSRLIPKVTEGNPHALFIV